LKQGISPLTILQKMQAAEDIVDILGVLWGWVDLGKLW
jgi:hypothetical protein